MAKKKTRKTAPLHESAQEMSTAQVWWWLVGGLVAMAILFAIIDILKAKYLG